MKLKVIGAYLPRMDQPAIEMFIAADKSADEAFWQDWISKGKTSKSMEEVHENLDLYSRQMSDELQHCALFEIEVVENDGTFEPASIECVESGMLGWEPAVMIPTGNEVALELTAPTDQVPLEHFLVAVFIHDWEEGQTLKGPTGLLDLPPFGPVPERLWRMAPYTAFD